MLEHLCFYAYILFLYCMYQFVTCQHNKERNYFSSKQQSMIYSTPIIFIIATSDTTITFIISVTHNQSIWLHVIIREIIHQHYNIILYSGKFLLVFNFVIFVIKISKQNYMPTKTWLCVWLLIAHAVLTKKYLIITGHGLLVTEEKQNKTQWIEFPGFITNIYIHRNFLLYGTYTCGWALCNFQ